MNEDRLAAAQEVAGKEGLPGHDLARLVEAHDRCPQSPDVAFGLGAFLPAAAFEIIVGRIAAVRELLRERIFEGAAPKDHRPVIAEDVAEIVEVELRLFQNGPEMGLYHHLDILPPGVAGDEFHEAKKVVSGFHARASSGGVRR